MKVDIIKLFFIAIFVSNSAFAGICEKWFQPLNLKNKKDCVVRCSIATTDMATFDCHNECERLCKNDEVDIDYWVSLLMTYGLSDSEIKYCKENKEKCFKAYMLGHKAEGMCSVIYQRSDSNDESDACRHFVWANLLSREVGNTHAQTILDAHESNPKEPQDQMAMDLANNRLGLIYAQSIEVKQLSDEIIMKQFKEYIKAGKFVVIKPKYSKKGGLP